MEGHNSARRHKKGKHQMLLPLTIVMLYIFFIHNFGSYEDWVYNEQRQIIPVKTQQLPARKFHDLGRQKGCAALNIRPIPDDATWGILRKAYRSVVGAELSTIGDLASTDSAFTYQISAKQSSHMGRGIFAEEDIPKGEIMYNFGRTAQFQTGNAFRDFLDKLPDKLACDALMWAYVVDFSDNEKDTNSGNLRICVDLDSGSFCNDGRGKKSNMAWEDNNDAYKPAINEQGVKISAPLRSLRDIKKGEEILCYYAQFTNAEWAAFRL